MRGHRKNLLSLQASLDHKFENVFCLLIRTKLEPCSMVLETPLSSPLEGNHSTSYTYTWLYEDI